MTLVLFSFRCLILILISSFSMLIQPGLSWHASSADMSAFYSMPSCWAAMQEMMVCGYKISQILGGNLGVDSMNLGALSEECCKSINDVSSKCTFDGVINPLNLFLPPFVKDLCFGNKNGDFLKPNHPFVDDPIYGPFLKNALLKNNHGSTRKLHRILPIRSRLFIPNYNLPP
ncbi:hypothetical protein HAX54_033962 [Datura stramonium]|uniref:Prolamin-like domain-containing protein n=1 Tax=Datura stramonium TaxID=4076 RepID=A0ABS8SE17_DATST|nr:hypothetical protein [Datura stramonium]